MGVNTIARVKHVPAHTTSTSASENGAEGVYIEAKRARTGAMSIYIVTMGARIEAMEARIVVM